jgi:ATP-binding cassette subfamily C protein
MKLLPPTAYTEALKDMRKGAAAAGFVGFFVNLLHLALPLYSIQIYDRVISSGSVETLIALTGLILAILLFQSVLDYLRGRIFSILGARLAARLGTRTFEASVETTLGHGPASASGAIRDLQDLRGFVASGALALPMDLAIAPILLLALFLMSPVYGIIGLLGAGLLLAMAFVTELAARRPTRLSTQALARVQAETAGAIRNAEAIVAMGMLPDLARRWRGAQAIALEIGDGGSARARAFGVAAKALRFALQVAIIAAGAMLVIDQLATIGTIIASAVILSRLLLPFEQMIDGWRQWVDALAALDRLRDILTKGATTRSQVPVEISSGKLTVDRVSFVPPGQDRPVLRNVSFGLEQGEMLGVIGASGAGKSSLARLIVGLASPTTGGIYLDGQNTFTHERSSFGRAVGYLPQDPMLFEATVRENIARFRDAPIADVVEAARIAGVHQMIGRLPRGYETRIADGNAVLSGGQRQRLALARAIFGRPRLVVLDEPNSNLDADGEAALVDAIDVLRDRGVTVVVIAQRMSILKRADCMMLMKDGAIAKIGSRQEVISALSLERSGPTALPPPERRRA